MKRSRVSGTSGEAQARAAAVDLGMDLGMDDDEDEDDEEEKEEKEEKLEIDMNPYEELKHTKQEAQQGVDAQAWKSAGWQEAAEKLSGYWKEKSTGKMA